MEDLVKEAAGLAKNGVKELLLIAQDSTYYGLDIYNKRVLAELMTRLSEVDGIDWIRLHYAFPTGFPMDVLDVIAENPKICRYLDIPLQHGSTEMLKRMRRGTTREKTDRLLDEIRGRVPEIAIRTTLIAGHPGETVTDFEEMLDFVERQKFDRLGVFTYSHEENTHSFGMNDDVPEDVKKERADIIMEAQAGISHELNQNKVGNSYKVLIDRVEDGNFIGRSEFDSPEVDNEVIINAEDHYLRVGDFAEVKIESATEFDLTGIPVK